MNDPLSKLVSTWVEILCHGTEYYQSYPEVLRNAYQQWTSLTRHLSLSGLATTSGARMPETGPPMTSASHHVFFFLSFLHISIIHCHCKRGKKNHLEWMPLLKTYYLTQIASEWLLVKICEHMAWNPFIRNGAITIISRNYKKCIATEWNRLTRHLSLSGLAWRQAWGIHTTIQASTTCTTTICTQIRPCLVPTP